jgi:hypothetical protein
LVLGDYHDDKCSVFSAENKAVINTILLADFLAGNCALG